MSETFNSGLVIVSRRPTLKRGSGETLYKKFELWNVYWMTFTCYVSTLFKFTVTELDKQFVLKQEIYLKNRRSCEELASALHPQLSLDLQCAREFACLKGASSWLTALPIDEHGFALHKSDFRDAVCLRYG